MRYPGRNPFGARRREDFAPADLMRGVERNRARFLDELLIDPTPWKIATYLRRTLKGSYGEGLRGVFIPTEGEHGRLYWWGRDAGSHHQGRLMLKLPVNRQADTILEVEANVDTNGTIYLCWSSFQPEALGEAFLRHPSIGPLIDGSLTYAGRQIQIDRHACIHLLKEAAPAVDRYQSRTPERPPLWDALADEADSWARTRRRTLPDGRAMPDRGALATFRLWINCHLGWHFDDPLPTVTFGEDGNIVAAWRATDMYGAITFSRESLRLREVIRGRVTEHVVDGLRTPRQMQRANTSLRYMHEYRSAEEGPR